MGGGDLNSKKSWHPKTMKNQEKVWKVEEAKRAEEARLKELRREIEAEKDREDLQRIGRASGVLKSSTDNDQKLEWMYKKSHELINREEYLLGRKIDKTFEELEAEEKMRDEKSVVGVKHHPNHVEHECVPFSIREYRNMQSTEQVDLQRKVMEDPLMLIRQREIESRRKILENPVKLKELHRLLKTEVTEKKDSSKKVSKKSKKSKKKKSKNKKKHKRSKSSDSSSSSSSSDSNEDSDKEADSDIGEKDIDRELEKRYSRLKGSLLTDEKALRDLDITKLLDSKYDTISKELDRAINDKTKEKKRNRSSSSESPSNNLERRNQYDRNRQSGFTNRTSASLNRQERQRDSYDRNRPRGRGQWTDRRQPSRQSRSRSRSRRTSNSPRRQDARSDYRRRRSPVSKSRDYSDKPSRSSNQDARKPDRSNRLTEEEKEARRKEMEMNAAWRETDRKTAVHKHRAEYAKEEEEHRNRDFDKEFLNKQVKKAIANQTSIGSRLKSNLNNIQRSESAMHTNFARK